MEIRYGIPFFLTASGGIVSRSLSPVTRIEHSGSAFWSFQPPPANHSFKLNQAAKAVHFKSCLAIFPDEGSALPLFAQREVTRTTQEHSHSRLLYLMELSKWGLDLTDGAKSGKDFFLCEWFLKLLPRCNIPSRSTFSIWILNLSSKSHLVGKWGFRQDMFSFWILMATPIRGCWLLPEVNNPAFWPRSMIWIGNH